MEKNSCLTYIYVLVNKLRELDGSATTLEAAQQNSDEMRRIRAEVTERLERLTKYLGLTRFGFEIGYNTDYDVDVNVMIRRTIKDLKGKERTVKALCEELDLSISLRIVPYIVADSDEPHQMLSLDRDIIEFLYESGISLDFDYYVI